MPSRASAADFPGARRAAEASMRPLTLRDAVSAFAKVSAVYVLYSVVSEALVLPYWTTLDADVPGRDESLRTHLLGLGSMLAAAVVLLAAGERAVERWIPERSLPALTEPGASRV